MPVKGRYSPSVDDTSTGVKGDYTSLASSHEPVNTQTDWTVPAIAAGAVGAGAYALSRNPNVAKRIGNTALELRQISMLSGLAPLKSLLGNIGGSAYASLERGSLAPLREVLSSTTAKDAAHIFRRGANYAHAGPTSVVSRFNLPGRVMGSIDEASQNALMRAGLTSKDAAREMLQAPIPTTIAEKLDNPVAKYLVPFRRTPINQLFEGMNTFKADTTGKKIALATSGGTGFATGAEAEDPKTVALGTAASGRYGVPFALSAALGRYMQTGSKQKAGQVVQGMSPVSDYSLNEGVVGPVAGNPLPKPAAVSAYDYLKHLFGVE